MNDYKCSSLKTRREEDRDHSAVFIQKILHSSLFGFLSHLSFCIILRMLLFPDLLKALGVFTVPLDWKVTG